MSQFNLPRINFHGSGYLDTPTANNGYIPNLQIFDQNKSKAFMPPRVMVPVGVTPPEGATVHKDHSGNYYINPLNINEQNFKEWCTYPLGTYPADSSYAEFYKNKKVGNGGKNPGYWNYFGDLSMTLDNVLVTGITVPSTQGAPITYPAGNIHELNNTIAQLMGAELSFNKDYFTPGCRTSAYLCDVDSEGQLCTQIFFGQAGLYNVVDGKNITYFKGEPVKSTVRFMNLNRVLNYANLVPMGGSASFFTTVEGSDNELVKLLAPIAGDQVDGIFIKILIHEVYEVRNPQYNVMPTVEVTTVAGKMVSIQKNPAKISISGSITPWKKTGMKTASICRILKNPMALPLTLITTNIPDPVPYKSNKQLGLPASVNLAPIPFIVDTKRDLISLDLCNMLMEYGTNPGKLPAYAGMGDIQPYQDFVNYNFENINVSFRPDNGSNPVFMGSIAYTDYVMSRFITTGGVADLPLPKGIDYLNGSFSIWVKNVEMWMEDDLYLVSDQAGIYAEQNQQPPGNFMSDGLPKGPCYLRVFKRGVPVAQQDAFDFIFQACNLNTMSTTNISQQIYDGVSLAFPVTDDGCITYIFPTSADENFPKKFSLAAFTYIAMNSCLVVCRVLADDASLTPYLNGEQTITWEVVYEKVLELYKMIYPIMDIILPINPTTWGDAFMGQKIKSLTDESNWQYPLFMPVTRDMSAAQRKLLHMWIDQLNSSTLTTHAPKK